jgi:hypothetical protein
MRGGGGRQTPKHWRHAISCSRRRMESNPPMHSLRSFARQVGVETNDLVTLPIIKDEHVRETWIAIQHRAYVLPRADFGRPVHQQPRLVAAMIDDRGRRVVVRVRALLPVEKERQHICSTINAEDQDCYPEVAPPSCGTDLAVIMRLQRHGDLGVGGKPLHHIWQRPEQPLADEPTDLRRDALGARRPMRSAIAHGAPAEPRRPEAVLPRSLRCDVLCGAPVVTIGLLPKGVARRKLCEHFADESHARERQWVARHERHHLEDHLVGHLRRRRFGVGDVCGAFALRLFRRTISVGYFLVPFPFSFAFTCACEWLLHVWVLSLSLRCCLVLLALNYQKKKKTKEKKIQAKPGCKKKKKKEKPGDTKKGEWHFWWRRGEVGCARHFGWHATNGRDRTQKCHSWVVFGNMFLVSCIGERPSFFLCFGRATAGNEKIHTHTRNEVQDFFWFFADQTADEVSTRRWCRCF